MPVILWEWMDLNQLTFTGTDLQSAATLQLRRTPIVILVPPEGNDPSTTELSALALASRTQWDNFGVPGRNRTDVILSNT